MEDFLKEELLKHIKNDDYYSFSYQEDINNDALTDAWLEKETSYIYKVAVMTAIDSNKFDFAHVVIGVQREQNSDYQLKGYLYFSEGENDDMGRVIKRSLDLLEYMHSAFKI